mgnify:FL=1
MKKSTIALIVAAVVCLGLSAFSAKASVTRTNEAIEEIGEVTYSEDCKAKIDRAVEYYNALDKNLDLQEKVNKEDMKNFDAAKIEYARLAIKAASVADARKVPEGYTSDDIKKFVTEAREVVDSYLSADQTSMVPNYADLTELEKAWMEGIEYLKQFHFVDSEHEVNNYLKDGKSVLCEGAQGTMLDIDFGSYPFVTSSNTVCAGACTGLGVAPNRIGEVFGIFKAYCTRVGAGPFPTELFDETGDKMCTLGHEFGSVTGRKRRCGWIDLVALKYSVMINGVTKLIMMKSDVLDTFDTIKACVAYKVDGEEIDYFPYDITEGVEPVYAELPGWKTDMTKMQSEDEFPEEFNAYLTFLEEQLGVEIKIVSVGPDRAQTIERYTEE